MRNFSAAEVAEAAKEFDVAKSSIEMMVGVLRRNKKVFNKVKTGELNIMQGYVKVGYKTAHRATDMPSGQVSYKKGDKFWQAISPISLYLKAWEEKDFVFGHLPPAEAKSRLEKIRQVQGFLERAAEDLEDRADNTRLALSDHIPKKKKEK